jgi:tetratricopeptide (TPR) repeat protein
MTGAVGVLLGDGIPVELFEIGEEAEVRHPSLHGLSKNVEGILNALDEAGLVEWNSAERVVRCHERVQQAARLLGTGDEKGVLGGLTGCLESAIEGYRDRWDERDLLVRLCRQAERVVELCDTAGVDTSADMLSAMGWVKKGILSKLGEALERHERALRIQMKMLGEEHPDTAASLSNIGEVYYSMGKHERALEHHERALRIMVKVLGEEHPSTITSRVNLAQTHFCLKHHTEARLLAEAVLRAETALPDAVKGAQSILQVLNSQPPAPSHTGSDVLSRLQRKFAARQAESQTGQAATAMQGAEASQGAAEAKASKADEEDDEKKETEKKEKKKKKKKKKKKNGKK